MFGLGCWRLATRALLLQGAAAAMLLLATWATKALGCQRALCCCYKAAAAAIQVGLGAGWAKAGEGRWGGMGMGAGGAKTMMNEP